MNTTYCITGVSGYIGRLLAKRLASDPQNRVIGIDVNEPENLEEIEFHRSDIRDPNIANVLKAENVDVLIHNLPGGSAGLLGNSFLSKFKVVLDSVNRKMTLHPVQGTPSPDRPGGYSRDFWVGQFRFYNRVLEELKKAKQRYEGRGGSSSELVRVNNAIRYFENQLDELERKASFAGVPRNWRQ